MVHIERFCAGHEFWELDRKVQSGEAERLAMEADMQRVTKCEDEASTVPSSVQRMRQHWQLSETSRVAGPSSSSSPGRTS